MTSFLHKSSCLGLALGLTAALTFPASEASARKAYIPELPSSKEVGNAKVVCGTCHVAANGNGPRNVFGRDFDDAGRMWKRSLASQDSDGDGFTNGEELGDPTGAWKKGDAALTFVSFPGNDESTPCGEGKIKAGNECNGKMFGGKTCADFNNQMGVLSCTKECKIDSSACMPAVSEDMSVGDTDMAIGQEDMAVAGGDLGGNTPDQGIIAPADMSNNNGGSDMGGMSTSTSTSTATSTSTGTSTLTTPGTGDDDEGCAQTGGAEPSAPVSLMVLAGGLVWLRRRLRN